MYFDKDVKMMIVHLFGNVCACLCICTVISMWCYNYSCNTHNMSHKAIELYRRKYGDLPRIPMESDRIIWNLREMCTLPNWISESLWEDFSLSIHSLGCLAIFSMTVAMHDVIYLIAEVRSKYIKSVYFISSYLLVFRQLYTLYV